MDHPKLVVVKTFNNRLEAELAKGAIENAGIEATIRADSVGRMREHVARTGAGFEIMVREQDAAAAADALTPVTDADFEEGDDAGRS